MWYPADWLRCHATPADRAGRVHRPTPSAASSRRLSVWSLCCAVLLLSVVFSASAAQAYTIDLSMYSTQYEANNGYVYTGRRAQVLHHLKEQFSARATTYASHSECPTCSADLWTPDARGGMDNTELRSMNDMAEYIRANSTALGIRYVIWNQRISKGGAWREMEDRGNLTANHKDHVHITFVDSFR